MLSQNAAQPAAAGPELAGVGAVAENSHVLDDAGENAPTLVEFLDFECEACGALYPVIEDIRAQYDGKINVVVRYFPLSGHLNSMNAAVAVEAAAQQGKFEEMSAMMFETQLEWGEKQESEAARFRGYADALGLDLAAFDAAVADPATQARVEEDLAAGQALGVQGTPTFFLDGALLQPTQISDITDALDRALALLG
ncbi:hypothetical protein D3228_03630 [Leucobacter luti]|nr:hypothetical protein [Leucobacter luti]